MRALCSGFDGRRLKCLLLGDSTGTFRDCVIHVLRTEPDGDAYLVEAAGHLVQFSPDRLCGKSGCEVCWNIPYICRFFLSATMASGAFWPVGPAFSMGLPSSWPLR